MPNFSRIVRVGFEIVVFWSGVRKMLNPAPRYPKLGTGPSPASPYFNVLTGTDHLALEAKQTTRRHGGGELVVEEEMKVHELLNYGVKRCQHTKMLSDSSVWGKTDIRRIG